MTHLRLLKAKFLNQLRTRDAIIIVTIFLGLWICGVCSVVCGQTLRSKKTSADTRTTSSASKPTKSSDPSHSGQNSPFTISGFEGQLVSAVDTSKPDTGDYIPCEFTLSQLLSLRPRPEVTLFGTYEEEKLRSTVIEEAVSQKASSAFPEEAKQNFIRNVSTDPFVGLTPSQALARVIADLNYAISNAQFMAKEEQSGNTGTSSATAADANGQGTVHPGSQSGVQLTQRSPPTNSQTGGQGTPAPAPPASSQAAAIVDSARSQISAFQRPTDIGCAMSIMEWNDIRYSFGQTIANEYIGVQVVVRNLNPNKEFLIHDAEISVDSDLNGRYGRFYSGQDKLVVRGFMLASRDYGRRNFIVHLAQGVGSVMSASSLVFGPVLQSATNVYNSGFLPALQNVWTDHNTDQLNLLNDVGFSASKTDRTVVPKSGTAMFVIFIPSKQFQNGWWVQDCANNIVLSPSQSNNGFPPGLGAASNSTQAANRVGQGSLQSGIDLESLRAVCLRESSGQSQPSPTTPTTANIDSNTSSFPQNVEFNNGEVKYMKAKAVPYKKWTPAASAIFRELSLAVVAGTHLTEDAQASPSMSTISCPVDELGNLDFSKASAGTLTCDLTGQSLDKAQTLKLRNAGNATDTQTAEGTVSTSGDSTKASAKFQLAQVGILGSPAYKVYTVTSAGVESGGTQVLHLSLEPFVSDDPSRAEINLDQLSVPGAAPQDVTLKGYHLDNLTSVHLGNSEKAVASTDSISIELTLKGAPSATAASFEFTSAEMAKLPPGDYSKDKLKLYLFVVSKDKPSTKAPSGQILLASGVLKAPAAKPAVIPPKAKTQPKGATTPK